MIRRKRHLIDWWAGDEAINFGDYDVFPIIGDSIAAGRSTLSEVGTTATAATVYEFNNSDTLVELTTADVHTAVDGSPWKKFGVDHNSNTSRKVMLVPQGSGGAEFYPDGDNNNWYTSGTLYDAMKSRVASALTEANANTPKGIMVILGINDIRSSNSVANIEIGIDSLFSRLIADYPNTEIYISIPGRKETTPYDVRTFPVRRKLRDVALANTNVIIANAIGVQESWGNYQADNLHLEQSGNNIVGEQFARVVAASSYSKWARSIIGSLFTDISEARKGYIDTFAQVYESYIDGFEGLYWFLGADSKDMEVDLSFLTHGEIATATLSANTHLGFNGTSNYFKTKVFPQTYGELDKDDSIYALSTDYTVGGDTHLLFGITDAGTANISFFQRNTNKASHSLNIYTNS